MSKWFLKSNRADTALMAKSLGINEITAYVMANRGVRTRAEAMDWLNPEDGPFFDESLLRDADRAAAIIAEATAGGVKIAVYGDYDVDGVVSTYMLYSSLKRYGADAVYFVPHREKDGYGLNINAINALAGEGVGLIITCDNGISALEEIDLAVNSLGLGIVVIDHHEITKGPAGEDILPAAGAVINPKRADCMYPYKNLCAAAVCYKFLKYFHKYLGLDFDEDEEFLALAALASVCDMVEIRSETRAIIRAGLRLLSEKPLNPGLSALIREKELAGRRLTVFDLGFLLGPCINAAGRLHSADLSVELLLAADEDAAAPLARKLRELNDERRALTGASVENALKNIAASQNGFGEKIIVYFDENIHESLAGIVAGRVRETVHRPAVVLTWSQGFIKGSARSTDGYNIYEGLNACRDLFIKFGGHEAAAGMSLAEENLDEFRRRLNENCSLTEDDFAQVYRIEKEIRLSDVTFSLAKELKIFEPHGNGNPEPLFATKAAAPERCEIIGESRKTLRFLFPTEDGRRSVKGICFNRADDFVEMIRPAFAENVINKFLDGSLKNLAFLMDMIYRVEINEYNGNEYLQIRLVDFRLSEKGALK